MSKVALELQLEAFQGPFDLLLHLIKTTKVDINDIPMVDITRQYLDYIKTMQSLQLDIASEYLVMAATLIEIKARMLLPIEPIEDLESDFQGDPRDVLVQQLLLYQQFQDVTHVLVDKERQRARHFSRPQHDLSEYQMKVALAENEVSLEQLSFAFQNVLQRQMARAPLQREIEHEPMTVSAKMDLIAQILSHSTNGIDFEQLLENSNRSEIITTFMAVLELVRKQRAFFIQECVLGPISVHLNREGEANGHSH